MEDKKRKLTRRFILFQLLAFASFAPMNYYNVFLKEIGLSSRQIGLWGSIGGVIAMVSLPVWGVISDKTRSLKKTYLISMAAYAVLYILLPSAGRMAALSTLPLYAVIVLYSLVSQPTHSLQDAWFIGTIKPYGIDYSALRLWGSAGFAVVSILIGLCVSYTGIDAVFYLVPIFVAPLIFLCICFKDSAYAPKDAPARLPAQKLKPWVLFRNYYFATAFIIVIVLAVYSALTGSFYAFILEHAGVSPEKYGIISGYGAFVQVGCLLVITRWCKKTPPARLLILGGLFGVAENMMYGLACNLAMMFVAGTFWGMAMAINVSVLPSYLFSLVPREYSATAQTLSGTALMLLSIVGNVASGYLIFAIGIAHYNFSVAVFQLVLVLLFAASFPFGRNVLKIEPAEGAGN